MSQSPISRHVMAFGWYLRRCPSADALLPFYRDVLTLPVMRGRDPVYFLWGGETFVFELKGDELPNAQRHTDPTTAPLVPVFECADLDLSLAHFEKHERAPVLVQRREHSREAYFMDPDHQLLCLRQADHDSPCFDDRIMRERAGRTPTYVHDWSEMSPIANAFRRVRRLVADLPAAREFFIDLCGFKEVGTEGDNTLLDLGDGFILELGPGGQAVPVPVNRTEVTNYFVMRVSDHDAVNAGFKKAGIHLVNDRIEFNSATLTYATDPDGLVIGFEERLPPHRWKQWRTPFAEDIEADRRFAAYGMNPRAES